MSSIKPDLSTERRAAKPVRYIAAVGAFTLAAVAALWQGNKTFAPEMYSRQGSVEIAEAFATGRNFAVFDLNINIRELRDEHIKRMPKTPDVVVLGASHWQEAHDWLIGHKHFYNAHIHRDYYEDMLGMVEMFMRHDRLPKQMIIAIRDNLFTPVRDRKDHLWLPGVPYYEAMAQRLGMKPHPTWETAPYQRWRELASLPMFYRNASRYANATFRPQQTFEAEHDKLDTLLPGGSIVWSHEHQALFTAKRTRELSDEFAARRINDPPKIDPKGVEHIDRLLQFLKEQGVEVILAHPPFNPDYYQTVMAGPYAKGLRRIEELTQNFADKYGWQVIGSFDPAKVGCEARMFIDAEHASPECLGKLFQEYTVLDTSKPAKPAADPSAAVASAAPAHTTMPRHRIAVAVAAPALATDTTSDQQIAPKVGTDTDATPKGTAIVIRPATKPVATAVQAEPTAPLQKTETSVVAVTSAVKKKTVHYPLRPKTKSREGAAEMCSPHIWPGDHAYPDRVRAVCGHRGRKVRGS